MKLKKLDLFDFLSMFALLFIIFYFASMYYTNYLQEQEEKKFTENFEELNKEDVGYIIEEKHILWQVFSPFIDKDILSYETLNKKNEEIKRQKEIESKNLQKLFWFIDKTQEEKIKKEKEEKIKEENLKIEEEQKKIEQEKKEEHEFWFDKKNWAKISIPSIKLDVKLITQLKEEESDKVENELKHWAVLFPGSLPWENWLSMIFAHSSQYISKTFYSFFYKLEKVPKTWAKIYVKNNKYIYEYETYDAKTIPPEEIKNLEIRNDEKTLILITCTPVWTFKNRYLLYWKLVNKTKIKE